MFKNESTNKLMSMAVVAMMMLCAFSVCFAAGEDDAVEPDGTTDNPYIINIRNGQTFTYTPTFNLSPVTLSLGTQVAGATISSNTLTYQPSNVTDGTSVTLDLIGTWNSGSSAGNLTQTAHQYIKFNVYNQTEILESWTGHTATATTDSATRTINVLVGDAVTVFNGYNYTISKGTSGSTANWEVDDFNELFTFGTASNGAYTITQSAVAQTTGTYTGTLTLKSDLDGTNLDQTKSITVTINVVEDMAFGPLDDTYYTYVGATGTQGGSVNSVTAAISNADSFNDVTYSFNDDSAATGFFKDEDTSTGYIAWDSTKSGITGTSKENSVVITATGSYTDGGIGGSTLSASASTTVKVVTYAALEFTNAPSVNSVSAMVGVGALANDVTVTASFVAAKKIVYNWGDGTSTSTNVTMSNAAKNYSAHHIYSVAGSYQVSITAVNDFGETTSHVLVTANGFGDVADDADYTITVKDKTGANVLGYFYVNEGQKLADVEFTPAEGVSFDAATQKLTALFENAATGSAALAGKTADLCAVVTSDDIYYAEIVEKGFFDYHGWDFIVFAVLAILSIVVYLYFFCHPAMPVLATIFAILAVASYLCGGITEIIPALQAAWNSWFPPAQ